MYLGDESINLKTRNVHFSESLIRLMKLPIKVSEEKIAGKRENRRNFFWSNLARLIFGKRKFQSWWVHALFFLLPWQKEKISNLFFYPQKIYFLAFLTSSFFFVFFFSKSGKSLSKLFSQLFKVIKFVIIIEFFMKTNWWEKFFFIIRKYWTTWNSIIFSFFLTYLLMY